MQHGKAQDIEQHYPLCTTAVKRDRQQMRRDTRVNGLSCAVFKFVLVILVLKVRQTCLTRDVEQTVDERQFP